jgi:DNA-binding MarR family transcriptional regulator
MADMNDKPGHLARRFQQIAVAVFHAEVGAVGSDLTPVQYAALAEVAGHPGMDQATLAGRIALDRATITGVIDRLEKKAYLTREVKDDDRRARVLRISVEGRRVLETIEPAVEAAQRSMLAGLSETEAAEFMRLLAKAIEAANDLSRAPLRGSAAEEPAE